MSDLLLALVTGFLLGCPLWAALWFAVLRRRRWTDDALCPHRKQPDPVLARWTVDHAKGAR